jgi:hypothetical protein
LFSTAEEILKEQITMTKSTVAVLFASLLVFSMSLAVSAQEAPAQAKAAKEARWHGTVIRGNPDKSTLTVRNDAGAEMTVQYDRATHWVSQEHGSKTVNSIDASQVKDNDRVICKGSMSKDGTLHATLISKRLSPTH